MNKKGDWIKPIIYAVIGIVFLVATISLLLNILGNDKDLKACPDDYCTLKSEGCGEHESKYPYSCGDKEHVCCMTLDEFMNKDERGAGATLDLNTSNVISPTIGNIYIKVGDGEELITNSGKILNIGKTYTIKVSNDGSDKNKCSIKLLDSDTQTIIESPGWASGFVEKQPCKQLPLNVVFIPTTTELNKKYDLLVTLYNETNQIRTAKAVLTIVQQTDVQQ